MSEYRFVKDAGPSDWSALPRQFKAGEVVKKFSGHTYGLDRDDFMFLGVETIPCVTQGQEAFFTVPVAMLADEAGKHPRGAYIRFPAPPRPEPHCEQDDN